MLKPRRKLQKIYPNADRYGEDGRRLYSAYGAATVARRPGRPTWLMGIRNAAIALALIAAVLVVILISALSH